MADMIRGEGHLAMVDHKVGVVRDVADSARQTIEDTTDKILSMGKTLRTCGTLRVGKILSMGKNPTTGRTLRVGRTLRMGRFLRVDKSLRVGKRALRISNHNNTFLLRPTINREIHRPRLLHLMLRTREDSVSDLFARLKHR